MMTLNLLKIIIMTSDLACHKFDLCHNYVSHHFVMNFVKHFTNAYFMWQKCDFIQMCYLVIFFFLNVLQILFQNFLASKIALC